LSTIDADPDIVAAAAVVLSHWWSYPTQSEVETWPDLVAVAERVSRHLSGDDQAGASLPIPRAGDVDEMLARYERLFVGPGPVPCPPYESCWRTDVVAYLRHSLMGPCIADLLEIYRRLGLNLDPVAGELPDHVAVEFEALAYAVSQADEGANDGSGNNSAATVGPDATRSLVEGHLSVWVPGFCHAVAEQVHDGFYADLAAITLEWFARIQRAVETASATSPEPH